ncbi:MAG TPA: YlcI/YnfO family protein [Thermomicrobiales bacterium]|nr:YlcI/YnfO family protein [Thermomicrobiales bacterium]
MTARDALTIRLANDVLRTARELKDERESLNDFVIEAIDREIRRRRGHQDVNTIRRLQHGAALQPDSTALIRALRERHERRD